MPFAVYSLPDTHTVYNHPAVGRKVLSDEENGGGQISIAYSQDMSNHMQTASGYTVINKVKSHAGTVTLEIPQNSPSDMYLRRVIAYLENAAASEFAQSTLTIRDTAADITFNCTGVTPQKRPDRAYAQQAGTLQYVLLCASIVET